MNARDAVLGANNAFKSESATASQSCVGTSMLVTDDNDGRLPPASSEDNSNNRSALIRNVQTVTTDDGAGSVYQQTMKGNKSGNSASVGNSALSRLAPRMDYLPGGAHLVSGPASPPISFSKSCSVDIKNKAVYSEHDDNHQRLTSCLNTSKVSSSMPEHDNDSTVTLEADSSNNTKQVLVPYSPIVWPLQQFKSTDQKEDVSESSHLMQLKSTGENQNKTIQSLPKVHDEIKNSRAPLVDAFTPFIQPSDTSLKAARERLVTALDQTRMLREAFSVRVYDKYRVVLRPVQSSVSGIIMEIMADPETVNIALSKHMKMIKDEKEFEKKEAQKMNAEVAASTKEEGNGGFVNAENAEHLSWFGAGLSLVILPEEDVNDADLAARGIKQRGPTDLSTGSRVGGISSAAAAAAEQILDRVRKGVLLRAERSRVDVTSDDTASVLDEGMRSITSTSLSVAYNACGVPWCDSRNQSQTTVPLQPVKTLPQTGLSKSYPPLSDTNRKASKVRLPSSVVNFLSLSASGEGLGSNGRPTAATTALIDCGVGSNITSSKISGKLSSSQQNFHPQSKAGKKVSLLTGGGGLSAKKGSGTISASTSTSIPGNLQSICLPSLPTNSERRAMRPVAILQNDQIILNEAYKTVKAVINEFLVPSPVGIGIELPIGSNEKPDINGAIIQNSGIVKAQDAAETDACDGLITFPKPLYIKRRITEIEFMRRVRCSRRKTEQLVVDPGMQGGVWTHNCGDSSINKPCAIGNNGPSDHGSLDQPVDPHLAFSVLHALGVINDSLHSSTSDAANHESDYLNNEGVVAVLNKCGSRFQFGAAAIETAANNDKCSKTEIDFLARNPVCVQSLSFSEKIVSSFRKCSTGKKQNRC